MLIFHTHLAVDGAGVEEDVQQRVIRKVTKFGDALQC